MTADYDAHLARLTEHYLDGDPDEIEPNDYDDPDVDNAEDLL